MNRVDFTCRLLLQQLRLPGSDLDLGKKLLLFMVSRRSQPDFLGTRVQPTMAARGSRWYREVISSV